MFCMLYLFSMKIHSVILLHQFLLFVGFSNYMDVMCVCLCVCVFEWDYIFVLWQKTAIIRIIRRHKATIYMLCNMQPWRMISLHSHIDCLNSLLGACKDSLFNWNKMFSYKFMSSFFFYNR